MQPSYRLSLDERRRLLASFCFTLCCMAVGLHQLNGKYYHGAVSFIGPCSQPTIHVHAGKLVCHSGDSPKTRELRGVQSLLLGVSLDLNQATAHDLTLVSGIGPKLSHKILSYRQEIGGFTSMSELERVKGIGPKLRSRVEVLFKVD